MSAMNDFHHQAINHAARGFMEQMQGAIESASRHFEQALELELAAIGELTEPVEPTHSVLHRSAGWMAFHCGQYRKAEQLATFALAKEPPPEIAHELRELLQEVYAQWLERSATKFSTEEDQAPGDASVISFVSVVRPATGSGIALHPDTFLLTREPGHSFERVIHVYGCTNRNTNERVNVMAPADDDPGSYVLVDPSNWHRITPDSNETLSAIRDVFHRLRPLATEAAVE